MRRDEDGDADEEKDGETSWCDDYKNADKTIAIHKHTQTVQINKLFQSRHFAALRDCDSCILIQID